MLLDWINGNLESIFFLLLLLTFGLKVSNRLEPLFFLLLSNIITLFNVLVPIHFLPLSMLLYVSVSCVTFHKEQLDRKIIYALIAFLCSIILQFSLLAFLPLTLLQTHKGNFIGNLAIIGITGAVFLYVQNKHLQNPVSSFLWRFRAVLLILLAIFLIIGQFYLSRLISIWVHLPGIIAFSVMLFLVASIIIYIRYQQSTDRIQADLFRRHIKNYETLTSTMRIQQHDFKHHIHHLQNMIASSTDLHVLQQEVNTYVSQMDEDRSFKDLLLSVDDPMIRAFLFGCYDQCNKNEVQLQVESSHLLPVFPLKDYQLIEVLENLFSNALEHNLSLPKEKRWIKIVLKAEDGLQLFSIENPADEISLSLEQLFAMNVSTKKGTHQGLGLSSIQNTLSQNGILFSGKRNLATRTILFSFTYQGGRHETNTSH